VLGTLFGTQDYSYLRDGTVTDRLRTLAGRLRPGAGRARLRRPGRTDHARPRPAVPVAERMAQAVIGPLIATDRTDPVTGTLDLDSVSVSAT